MELEQHELYEYARGRITQKKRLFYHFIALCVGSVFLIVANKWLGFYQEKNWWSYAIAVWIFIFVLHLINVFVIDSFMNKHWERNQIDKLLLKQTKKVEQLKNDLENS